MATKKSNAIFSLTGDQKGKDVVLLDRYKFVEGKMETTVSDAILIEPLLCRYYGVKLEYEYVEDDEGIPVEAGSLKASETKGGAGLTDTEAEKAAIEAAEKAKAEAEATAKAAEESKKAEEAKKAGSK